MTSAHGGDEHHRLQQAALQQGTALITHLTKWKQSLHFKCRKKREENQLCSPPAGPPTRQCPELSYFHCIGVYQPTGKRTVYKQSAVLWERLSYSFEFLKKSQQDHYTCIGQKKKKPQRKFNEMENVA